MKKLLLATTLIISGSAFAAIPEGAVNLSADGTANCYLVAPGTTAYFDATHKGNSRTEQTGDIAGVKLVWQTIPSLISNLEFDEATGTICAHTSDNGGNALVAAVDNNGKILWSWHLWVTEYDPADDYTTPANDAGKSWTFMSRNLGAVSDERGAFTNFGMLYQWGRKDPFPGAATFTIMNDDYTYVVDGEPKLYDIDNNELPKLNSKAEYHGTLQLSIENPDVFYAMTYNHTGELDEYGEEIVKNDYPTGDWTDDSNDDFWGGESKEKSIYDPSPVGYKVPVCDDEGNTPYDWLQYSLMTWDTAHRGAEQNGQWFPATGTRVYASGTLDFPAGGNPYSGLWIGTKGKTSSNLEEYPDLYGQYMFIINGKRTFKVSKDKRSQGLSLRCVRDEDFHSSAVKLPAPEEKTTASPLYNLQGMMLIKEFTPEMIRSLAPGIYIYKGKKVSL